MNPLPVEDEQKSSRHSVPSTSEQIPLPTHFRNDVKPIFKAHLASLHVDAGLVHSVKESRSFNVCLQSIAYRISYLQYEMDISSSTYKQRPAFAGLGFYRPMNPYTINHWEKVIGDEEEEKAELTELLDQARHLGLGQDVDNVTRASQFNIDMRKLVQLADDEAYSGHWDRVLRHLAESVNLLSERNEAWSSWPDLDLTRQQTMDPLKVYGYDDSEWDTGELIIMKLLRVLHHFSPLHAADVSKYVKFHSRYLDLEIYRMSRFIGNQSTNKMAKIMWRFMTNSEVQFCELGIKMLTKSPTNLLTLLFGLRLYRLCLSLEEWELADQVMKMRFTLDNPDQHEVVDILKRLLIKLKNNPLEPTGRILLNGDNDDVDAEYELPEGSQIVDEQGYEETPWWMNEFRQRKQSEPSMGQSHHAGTSADSAATTRQPSTSGQRRFDEAVLDLPVHSGIDPLSANQKAACMFATNNTVCDNDTYTIPFSSVCVTVQAPIVLKWTDYKGDQERKTNVEANVSYHCRILTYEPINDRWIVKSDMCRISSLLSVEKPGATCVPFVGDCGENMEDDSFVFKIHKSLNDFALREYMADVRTQSTAAWYVNRFSKLTQDRFGILKMFPSDCVIVYQNSQRDIILEIMTRERHFRAGGGIKFDKYTSNTSWRNKQINTGILEAFSHFTHHNSEENLMVTDLQGWVSISSIRDNIVYTLTDPVIHCLGEPYRFGDTNLRYEGTDKFFRHVHPSCNHICEYLNLTRPEEYPELVNLQPEPDES